MIMLRPKDLCQGSGTKTFLEAMQSGKVHLARFVLEALDGRILNCKTENSRTLLMHAVCLQEQGSRSKFTQLLLEKGADVNIRDDQGRTALSFACEHGNLDSVKLLVQFNADPELTDSWGNSPLMYAACGGHSMILEFLVRAFKKLGLRLDQVNHAGHSAAQVADFFGHNQCVEALNGCGKKMVSPTNSSGEDFERPNRLPKHILERFSKQIHCKHEEMLPVLFQRQLRVGESNSLRIHHRRSEFQSEGSRLKWGDSQDSLFASKQMQNFALKDGRCADMDTHIWGKPRSMNSELRKQSYQGDIREFDRSASTFKRASLQDEKPLVARFYNRNSEDALKTCIPKIPKPGKLLINREDLAPERIKPRSSGFSGLGTRLLRRFTAPDFMRGAVSDPGHAKGKMSRSETFPFSHQRVNSQPSVDSISAVRCEFESNALISKS